MDTRAALKSMFERCVIWSGVARAARARVVNDSLVLAYHNVVPDDAPAIGDLPNHLPVSHFAAHLDTLRATHDVVSLGECLGSSGPGAKPRVAITFDDAYLGALSLGVAELVRRRMPATIFVAPGLLGGNAFWWDSVAVPGRGLDPADRKHALCTLAGRQEPITGWQATACRPAADLPSLWRAGAAEDVVRAASEPGISLGSHSWSHPNLTVLSPAELDAELIRSAQWLKRQQNAVTCIAYPYGLHNAEVRAASMRAGYEAGLAVSGGWLKKSQLDRFALPRVNVPRGLSERGLAIRAAGLLCR